MSDSDVQAAQEGPEKKVERLLREGEPAEFNDVPAERVQDKTIRAGFLRALIAKRLTDASVAPLGITITDAIIEGDLVFRGFGSSSSPLPGLDLSRCEINGTLDLTESCWTSVNLESCTLRGLTAPRLRVESGFAPTILWSRQRVRRR
jgi:hypothetical protein